MGLVNNLDQVRLETLELDDLMRTAVRREHGPLACCAGCGGLGSRLVPLSLATLT